MIVVQVFVEVFQVIGILAVIVAAVVTGRVVVAMFVLTALLRSPHPR